jgi:hypothetical protein
MNSVKAEAGMAFFRELAEKGNSWVRCEGKPVPQGLKPADIDEVNGTTKVVPLQSVSRDFFRKL